ncbi:MAG: hypothetical protein ACRDHM_00855 [Actinomycetota bacterium]
MARFVRILLPVALLVALGVPASAQEASCRLIRGAQTPDDPTDDVQVCRQDVWFHQAETKLGNAAALGQGSFPSFNTTRPTTSVTGGAGGGYLGSSVTHQQGEPFDPRLTATFDGTFTGDIDTLAVTVFMFNPPEDAQSLPTYAVNTRLVVDGEAVVETGGAEVKRSAGGQAAKRIDFAFVNVYQTLKDLGLNGADRQHQVRFQVQGTGLATEAALFVYDTSEVPSGLVFNIEPENLASYTIIS